MDRSEHWDRIYERRSPREVSWYERTLTISIRPVREAVDGGARTLLEVGAGASMSVFLDSERHGHLTPRGIEQRFIHESFRRVSEDRAEVPA
jgi:hypothetical protein